VAFRLIPREEKFYDDFVAIADQLTKGAALLEGLLSTDPPQVDKADEIKEIEHVRFPQPRHLPAAAPDFRDAARP